MTLPVIQIFGVKKCAETRKAERWFKERRAKIQMIDLREKGLSAGELSSVVSGVGSIEMLVDTESARYAEQGLKYAAPSKERLRVLLIADPLLLKTPVVRCGKQATVGVQPEVWATWR